MKKCIWCLKVEPDVSFKNIAHIVPQNLGGERICENVCDGCNQYFGNHNNRQLPIETAIRETFGITRARLLASSDEVGKNKTLPRFKSLYFNLDFFNKSIKVKPTYRKQKNFQSVLGLQLKKGLYKMFLEENERVNKNSADSQFDFIRQFARYNLVGPPIWYYPRRKPIVLLNVQTVRHPFIELDQEYNMKYLTQSRSFKEIEFLSHVFVLPIRDQWQLTIEDHFKNSLPPKKDFFMTPKKVTLFSDIDFTFRLMDT